MNLSKEKFSSSLLQIAEEKAVQYLEMYDEDYQRLLEEKNKLMNQYHNMLNFLEYNKPIQLSEEEHTAMINYLELDNRIMDMVKFTIYLCGYADCVYFMQTINKIDTVGNMEMMS